jgi:hypothetical protein
VGGGPLHDGDLFFGEAIQLVVQGKAALAKTPRWGAGGWAVLVGITGANYGVQWPPAFETTSSNRLSAHGSSTPKSPKTILVGQMIVDRAIRDGLPG